MQFNAVCHLRGAKVKGVINNVIKNACCSLSNHSISTYRCMQHRDWATKPNAQGGEEETVHCFVKHIRGGFLCTFKLKMSSFISSGETIPLFYSTWCNVWSFKPSPMQTSPWKASLLTCVCQTKHCISPEYNILSEWKIKFLNKFWKVGKYRRSQHIIYFLLILRKRLQIIFFPLFPS